ncbi:hypothetical protein [Chitinophaga sp. CB10]|uniref:hypothetical protein n=1 Tax=Chitinophaga sp. CB10 TaxID=1891659 RepID=UPI0025B9343A|nr:hypothetical protein [Chitinophaga sp. CB10]
MNNQTPPVTSTFFVALVKDYLRGLKTKAEVFSDITPVQPASTLADGEVTQVVIEAARAVNEDFYEQLITEMGHAADTTPTRAGMVHQLQALLQGAISRKDFIEWATWHNEPGTDNGGGFFDDVAVDYCCTQLLPKAGYELTEAQLQKALAIFSNPHYQSLKDKVALVLLTEQEQQRFLFYLGDFIQGHTSPEQLDVYLLNRFGMDHHSFPYMPALITIMHNPAKLPALLQVAMNGALSE